MIKSEEKVNKQMRENCILDWIGHVMTKYH